MNKFITLALTGLSFIFSSSVLAEGFNDNYLQVGYSTNDYKHSDKITHVSGSAELGDNYLISGSYDYETGDWSDPGEYETSTYSGYRVGIGKAYSFNGNTDITSSISYLDYTFKQTIKPNWRSTTTSRPTTKADSYIGSVGVRNMSPNNFETNLQINAFRGGKMKSKSNEVELNVIKHFNDKLGFGLRVLHHDAAPAASYKSDFTEYGLFIRTGF